MLLHQQYAYVAANLHLHRKRCKVLKEIYLLIVFLLPYIKKYGKEENVFSSFPYIIYLVIIHFMILLLLLFCWNFNNISMVFNYCFIPFLLILWLVRKLILSLTILAFSKFTVFFLFNVSIHILNN